MSYSISTLLTRNLQDVFGENDPVRRRAAIDEIWTEDGVFYDPWRYALGANVYQRTRHEPHRPQSLRRQRRAGFSLHEVRPGNRENGDCPRTPVRGPCLAY